MSHELREGVKLKSIFWPGGGEIKAGVGQCVSLVVAEQTGQMAMVPWVKAEFTGGRVALYDADKLEGCELDLDGVQ